MTVVDGISETDVQVAVAVLARRFPNTVVWFGESTRQWWALVWCGRWNLVEAVAPKELTRAIINTASRPWHLSVTDLAPVPRTRRQDRHDLPGRRSAGMAACP